MSSINLDLDFQDYTPTNSGRGRTSTQQQQQQPEVQVRIPIPADNATRNNAPNAKTVFNILQNLQPNKSPSGGLTDETLQQLMWLSARQKGRQQKSSSGNWGLGYFAQYFDVTTDDVLQRILWSVVPIRKIGLDLDDLNDTELTASLANNMAPSASANNDDAASSGDEVSSRIYEQLGNKRKHYSYIERFIQSRPDFYGPFWLSTTLIFAIAIFSNLLSFMKYRSRLYQDDAMEKTIGSMIKNGSNVDMNSVKFSQDIPEWHYSMDELSMATSVITFYVTLLPTFLWFLFWFRGCTKYYTLSETICAYGYSLSIFIPVTALLIFQAYLFRYLILIIASILSSLVLVLSFLPMIRSDPNAGSHTLLLIVPACQLGLAYILHRMMLQ